MCQSEYKVSTINSISMTKYHGTRNGVIINGDLLYNVVQ